jgi:hypothetical protein
MRNGAEARKKMMGKSQGGMMGISTTIISDIEFM